MSILHTIFDWQCRAIFESGLLLLLVAAIVMIFGRRLSPQWGIALLLLVVFKAVVPITLPAPEAVARFFPVRQDILEQQKPLPAPVVEQPRPEILPQPAFLPQLVEQNRVTHEPLPVETAVSPVLSTPQPIPETQPASKVVEVVPAPKIATPIPWSAVFGGLWLAIVATLFGRLTVRQIAFHRQMRLARRIELEELPLLCKRTGVNMTPVYESDAVGSPSVYGLFSPRIVLPSGLVESVSASELRWILLHELGHLARRDLWFVFFLKIVSVLFFFNPVLWISRKMIDRFREFACDDFATYHSGSSGLEASEAFMKILRQISPVPQPEALSLLDSRAATFRRMTRLLQSSGLKPARFGVVSLVIWGMLAVMLISKVDGSRQTADGREPKEAADLMVTVVDDAGKPVGGVALECRAFPKPANWDDGKFWGRTDANGVAAISWDGARDFDQFEMEIVAPGYAPYLARWEFTPIAPVPLVYVARLAKGQTLGGKIVDEQGNPVADAEMEIRQVELKDQVGSRWDYKKTFRTDANGRWTFESFPVAQINNNIQLRINRSGFAPDSLLIDFGEYLADADGKFTKTAVLKKGNALSGTVLDENGQPIQGASVLGLWNMESYYRSTTDAAGRFEIRYLPDDARTSVELLKKISFIAFVPGRKSVMKTVELVHDWDHRDRENPPETITLLPSSETLKIHVVDPDGKPLGGIPFVLTEIDDQDLANNAVSRVLEILLGTTQTDKNGDLLWNNPPDTVIRMMPYEIPSLVTPDFTIDPKDGGSIRPDPGGHTTPQLVKNVPNDFTLTLYPRFEVSGKVTDAATGELIPSFQVFQGFKRGPGELYWRQGRFGFVQNGHYAVNDDDEAEYFQIRIEAIGYEPLVSEKLDGNLRKTGVDFSLKKSNATDNIRVYTVLTPDGTPAKDAYVSIATLNPKRRVPPINNGNVLDRGWYDDETRPYSAKTDASGRFVFPDIDFAKERAAMEEDRKQYSFSESGSPLPDFIVLILHDAGARYLAQQKFESFENRQITLQKYARLEGIVKAETQPLAKADVRVYNQSFGDPTFYGPRFSVGYNTYSDYAGKITIEKIVPSERNQVNRNIGGKNSHYVRDVKFVSGETTFVQIGGVGRPVTGKLQVALDSGLTPDWDRCVIECTPAPTIKSVSVEELSAALPAEWRNATDDTKRGEIFDRWREEKPQEHDKYQRMLKEFTEKLDAVNKENDENRSKVRVCTVAADGSFRLDDITSGTWTLRAQLRGPRKEGQWGEGDAIGTATFDFTVPEIPGGVTDDPQNIGTVTVEKVNEPVR